MARKSTVVGKHPDLEIGEPSPVSPRRPKHMPSPFSQTTPKVGEEWWSNLPGNPFMPAEILRAHPDGSFTIRTTIDADDLGTYDKTLRVARVVLVKRVMPRESLKYVEDENTGKRWLMAVKYNPNHEVEKYTHPKCNQCEILVINGIAAHEIGCPDSWINPVTGEPYKKICIECDTPFVPENKIEAQYGRFCEDCLPEID